MTTSAPSENLDRLNGWKEIAAHLGKGTRTAQRWEREYGLPVHRVGREGGEIVFAFRDEIDRWSRRDSAREALSEVPASASPARGKAAEAGAAPGRAPSVRRAGWMAASVAVVVLAAFAGRRPEPAATATPGLPAGWRFTNGVLTVLDESGRPLFRHDLGPSVPGSASSAEPPTRNPMVRIVDLDGDGRPETLVSPPVERREESRLLCYEADGRLRFSDAPGGDVRFGSRSYGEPWLANRIFVAGPAGARSLYASFTHNLWFPARLRRLDPQGRLLSEYWSNGYVEFVDEATWSGRKVVLVGGVGNDVGGGSLAIFDPPLVLGHAPSADEEHRCRGCPEGGPALRLTFPTMCLLGRVGGLAAVLSAWVEAGDRLTVGVLQGRDAADGRPADAWVYYTFAADLSLLRVEFTAEFQALHARLERQGVLDHALGARDEADMFPVRLFDPRGVRVLKPVRVSR